MKLTRAAEVVDALRDVSVGAEALYSTMSAEELCRRPAPASWSAAECLAHLTISHNVYCPVWRDVYDAARKRGARGAEPYRMDMMGSLLNWALEPGRFKLKTPKNFQPVDIGSPDQVLRDFLASQRSTMAFLSEGAGLPLDRMMIQSPINAHVRYSVWSSFVIIATHGRRHLLQAQRC